MARRRDSNPAMQSVRAPGRLINKDVSMRDQSPNIYATPNLKAPVSPPAISLGQTKLSEYTKLSVLGKGTYGEVHKCVHTPSGIIVAMKTYIFEVSSFSTSN